MTAFHDERRCELGEGPLWHPLREQLYWFDILGKRLMTQENGAPREWQFDEHVSAAGWVGRDALLIASESALFRFDLVTGAREHLVALEADNPVTRSNDGRADPYGGFWIGTMGKAAEAGAGSIWRYFRGELRRLYPKISISNAICFAPDGDFACFTDTDSCQIQRVSLDADGWPVSDPVVHVDTRAEGLRPDGAVIDREGNLWVAHWGAGCVAAYAPDGKPLTRIDLPVRQPSCPAFGGADMTTLFVTSAQKGMTEDQRAAEPHSGKLFRIEASHRGQYEHQVIL